MTGLSQTARSENLRLLRSHALVRYRKQGQKVNHSLDAQIRLLRDVPPPHVGHKGRPVV